MPGLHTQQADELRAHTNCVRYVPCTPLCRSIIVSVCKYIRSRWYKYQRRLALAHARQQQSRRECVGFGQELLCLSATTNHYAFASNSSRERERERAMSRETINQTKSAAPRTQRQTALVCLSATTIRAVFIHPARE